ALPRDGQISLDSPRVEILIERGDQKESVNVRADDLLFGPGAFGLAHEFAAAWQHGMDQSFVFAFDRSQRDPVADCGKSGAPLALVPQPSGDFGQYLALRGINAVELIVFKRDATRRITLLGVLVKMRGEEIAPAVTSQLLIAQTHFNLLLKI